MGGRDAVCRAVAFREETVADLTPIRLLKPYRSFRAGDILQATSSLARRLVALGVACVDAVAAPGRPTAAVERAVATGPREVR